MSEVTRCTVCLGVKTVKGLGGVRKKCAECKGVGFVSIPVVEKKNNKKEVE